MKILIRYHETVRCQLSYCCALWNTKLSFRIISSPVLIIDIGGASYGLMDNMAWYTWNFHMDVKVHDCSPVFFSYYSVNYH